MWLIDVKSRVLKEFVGSKVPEYAILSHTWEDEEVTYRQYLAGDYHGLKGYHKIDWTCRIAKSDGVDYAWVDTCCIDKSSSAELSEAINAMYRWYQRAKVCYVYLSDLPPGVDWEFTLGRCRWFTRGWTLQELIAPSNIVFFDSQWNTPVRGTKVELAALLSAITKIDRALLQGQRTLDRICVAQKMSWAANRSTSRLEDTAYCLLGIFDLNMPLLYGEEEKAFRRLQEEIIRSNIDLSILAWSLPTGQLGWPASDFASRVITEPYEPIDPSKTYLCGLLARRPADFWACGSYERAPTRDSSALREFGTSNAGIRIRATLLAETNDLSQNEKSCSLTLPLGCTSNGRRLGVLLKLVGSSEYLRKDPWMLHHYSRSSAVALAPSEVYLLPDLKSHHARSVTGLVPLQMAMQRIRRHVLRVRQSVRVRIRSSLTVEHPWPADRYDNEESLFFLSQDLQQDFCIIDATFEVFQKPESTVRCAVIALGWSGTYTSWPQIGVVSRKDEHTSIVDQLKSRNLAPWQEQIRSKDIAAHLRQHKVARVLPIQQPITGSDMIAVISLEWTKLDPTKNNVSREICYNLKIRAETLDAHEVQPIECAEWDLDATPWS